jgi:hypothetical protein
MTHDPRDDRRVREFARTAANNFFNDAYQTLLCDEEITLPYCQALDGIEISMDEYGDPVLVVLEPESVSLHMQGLPTAMDRARFTTHDRSGDPIPLAQEAAKEVIRERDQVWRVMHPDAEPIQSWKRGMERLGAVLKDRAAARKAKSSE